MSTRCGLAYRNLCKNINKLNAFYFWILALFLIMCMCVCFRVCILECVYECKCPRRPEEGVRLPQVDVTDGCELLYGCPKPNVNPLSLQML